jgi:hypothetical protein
MNSLVKWYRTVVFLVWRIKLWIQFLKQIWNYYYLIFYAIFNKLIFNGIFPFYFNFHVFYFNFSYVWHILFTCPYELNCILFFIFDTGYLCQYTPFRGVVGKWQGMRRMWSMKSTKTPVPYKYTDVMYWNREQRIFYANEILGLLIHWDM